MFLLHQSISFKEWENILYLQNVHWRATSTWETMTSRYESERYFMQNNNNGKQAREDEEGMAGKWHYMELGAYCFCRTPLVWLTW